MRQEFFTCDRCKTTATVKEHSRPEGWPIIVVKDGHQRHAGEKSHDLCSKCGHDLDHFLNGTTCRDKQGK